MNYTSIREQPLEVKGREAVPLPFVELVLKLHPMQPECVEEALHYIHAHENEQSGTSPHHEADNKLKIDENLSSYPWNRPTDK